MRSRSVLILAVMVAALAAFAWFVDRDQPGSEERRRLADRLLTFESEQVERLEIVGSAGSWVMEKAPSAPADNEDEEDAGSEWALIEPLAAAADSSKIEGLLDALLALDVDRSLAETDPADYGLVQPRWTIGLTIGDGEVPVRVGDSIAGLDRVAVSVDGESVDLVPDHWLDLLAPGGTGWRSPQLFGHRRDDIARIRLVGPDPVVVLERVSDGFRIIEPFSDRADRGLTDSLLAAIEGLNAEEYLQQSTEVANADDGLAALELTLSEGDGVSMRLVGPEEIAVDGTLARAETSAVAEAVSRAAADWRSRIWSPVDGYEVDAAVFHDASGETRLEKSEGDWLRDGDPIGFSAATGPLYAMAAAEAEDFAPSETVAGRQPVLEATLTSGDTTRELRLFDRDDSSGCAATVDDRAVVLELSSEACDKVKQSVAAMREADPIGAADADSEENPT